MKRVGLCEHTAVSEASQVLVGIGRELLSTTEALSEEVETSDLRCSRLGKMYLTGEYRRSGVG